MKPDPDYIKRLPQAFQDSPEPTMDIEALHSCGLSYATPEFYFHLALLNDQNFVVRANGEPGIGADASSLDDRYSWLPIPLRLTASGHEFAEAMNNNKAFEAVKKSFVTSGLSIMKDIAVAAFKGELARRGIDLGH